MNRIVKKFLSVVCAAAMLFSLCGTLPSLAMSGGGKPSGTIHHWGCDMSFYNVNGDNYSLVDFAKMKADGCDYVILRIGYEGSVSRKNTMDTAFTTLYRMAREADMDIGLYFYSLATTYDGAVEDAKWVIDVIESNNMYFEYPIYYDVEDSNQTSMGSTAMNNLCLGWCETLENAGYFPGIYGGITQVMNKLSSNFLSRYDTWVAYVLSEHTGSQFDPRYPTSSTASFSTSYGMWQYKWYNTDKTPSYDGSYWKDSYGYPLDCNVSYKDYPTIMETYGYNNVVTRHKITFETNGGSAVDPVYVTDGKTLTAPTSPTKYAFEFGGWYCDPELTSPYDFNTPVPYGFTLYAKWNEAYWGANTNLMPNAEQLQLKDFEGQGAIWPYWNNDAYGSVTFYNGVSNDGNWSWPSAYMSYENSFDSVGDTYLYLKKDGNSYFNVILTYLDKDGESHDLYLSDVANLSGTDFAPGYLEEFYNVGSYIRNIGHAPASGNVKFTKVTYFIIGEKDSYTTLYDCKMTSLFEIAAPYQSFYSKDLSQIGGMGSYTYNDGTLTMNAVSADGYTVRFTPNASFSPKEFDKLLMDVQSTAPFNVQMVVTSDTGDLTMDFRNEYFDCFDLTAAPTALPAGNWTPQMYLYGYYQWNGGTPASSTVKSVTISLEGKGTLTLKALQASRHETIAYVKDGLASSGNNLNGDITPDALTSAVYTVKEDTVSNIQAGTTAAALISGFNESSYLKVYDKNGNELAASSAVATGCVITVGSRSYTVAVNGDVNGDGKATSIDARSITLYTVSSTAFDSIQMLAADHDQNGTVSTSDVRSILRAVTA